MIQTARWLPLSLALHAAAVGGGVWAVRDLGEPVLFVDMRLIESEAPPMRGESPRAGSSARPGTSMARGPAARSTPAAPAREIAAPPIAPAPAIAAAPPGAAEPRTTAPPDTPAPSHASAPSAAPAPSVAPAPPPADAPADAPPSPSGAQSFVPSETTLAPDAGRGAASATSNAASAAGGEGVGAPARRNGGSADGPLALAMPGDSGVGAYGPYLSALRRRLQEALEYPAAARRRGLSGTVHLEVVLDATGRVSEVLLARSSSHPVLDDAALEAARRLRRVPFPPDVRPRPLRVLMPVDFQLR